jgi:hypothetical protein
MSDIQVIEVRSTSELPRFLMGYVCETSIENAVAQHLQKTGVLAKVVYRKVSAATKITTLYIETEGRHVG